MRKRNDHGLFFTLGIILLIIPLILFIAYYATMAQTKTTDTISKIRCDELHYFVEDIRGDLERALVIFGRRAAIYTIDDVIKSGRPLDNYAFNCSATCGVDCDKFHFNVNGSEAAMAELIMCGTLHGQNVSYMTNHTLSQWLGRIESHGNDQHFNVTIDLDSIKIIPQDPWSFMVMTNSTFQVQDETGTCYFLGDSISTSSTASIIGLEDPLYPLNTNAYIIKFIQNCSTVVRTETTAGCSAERDNPGFGKATGTVVFHSEIDPKTYCLSQSPEEIKKQILVLDQSFGGCNSYEEQACFNSSSPYHFAGVIDYGPNSANSWVEKCNVTIPWIMDTGDIDNITPRSPPRRVEECDLGDIYGSACVEIVNKGDCTIPVHSVILGVDSGSINTTCYQPSNASLYQTEGGYDGPSFFDRLDGRLNLSEKYRNQSLEYFNNSIIGLETIVSPYLLDENGVKVKANVSWVDYLYWAGREGCEARGVCESDKFTLRLDDAHARVYNVGTNCIDVSECPYSGEVCVDQFDQNNNSIPDWLDSDCSSYFTGCGTIRACDLTQTGTCSTCDSPQPRLIGENSLSVCKYYAYNNSEWHMYGIVPTIDGRLTIVFNGTSNASGAQKTNLAIYNFSLSGGCTSEVEHRTQLEPDSANSYCVNAGETYVLALDVNVPWYGYNGSYTLRTEIAEDPTCPSGPTTTTSSTTTTTTSTSTTIPVCGFFDDFESGGLGWSRGGAGNQWEVGYPTKGSLLWWGAHSGWNATVTDLNADYSADSNWSYTSRTIDLAAAPNPKVTFWARYNTETSHDYLYIEATNGSGNWKAIANYTGSNSAWTMYSYALDGYTSSQVRVRYRLVSDHNHQREGAYIDDVNVSCS